MFELTREMFSLMPWVLLVCFGGAVIIDILFGLFGAKSKQKLSFGFVVFGIIFAPFIEEMIFRGPIYWIANGKFSVLTWVLIVILAIIFGFIHGIVKREDSGFGDFEELNTAGRIRNIISATFCGLALGWLTVTTDSLAPAMIIHASHNTFCFILAGGMALKNRKNIQNKTDAVPYDPWKN